MLLWLKVFHIVFVLTWYVGIFYLPRIFVNLASNRDNPQVYEYLLGMSHRLLRFMTVIAVPGVILGLILWLNYYWNSGPWMHVKLLLVFGVMYYHHLCFKIHKSFKNRTNTKSHKYYRIFNELPLILLIGIVWLAVFKTISL